MATEYISREAAIEALCKAHSPYPRRREISIRAIQEIPAADVRPVVHGEWEEIAIIPDAYDIAGVITWASKMRCQKCGFTTYAIEGGFSQYNFCPNCGADLRKVVEIDQVKEDAE